MKRTSFRPRLVVTADGRGVVGHAGARMLTDLAEVTGLSTAMSEALAPMRQRERGYDPGLVALDVAVMLADGGEAIADLAVLRNQPDLFGPVASDATAWRFLDGIDPTALAGEALARLLRPGNSGSNTAADHITVLDLALAQIPDEHRHGNDIFIRGAGAAPR